jgi:hypothetical protein
VDGWYNGRIVRSKTRSRPGGTIGGTKMPDTMIEVPGFCIALLERQERYEACSRSRSSWTARPIHGSGRMALIQSANDGIDQVLADVLLADPPYRDDAPGRDRGRCPEDRFRHEDAVLSPELLETHNRLCRCSSIRDPRHVAPREAETRQSWTAEETGAC